MLTWFAKLRKTSRGIEERYQDTVGKKNCVLYRRTVTRGENKLVNIVRILSRRKRKIKGRSALIQFVRQTAIFSLHRREVCRRSIKSLGDGLYASRIHTYTDSKFFLLSLWAANSDAGPLLDADIHRVPDLSIDSRAVRYLGPQHQVLYSTP